MKAGLAEEGGAAHTEAAQGLLRTQKQYSAEEQAEVQGLLDRATLMTNFSATNFTKAHNPHTAEGGEPKTVLSLITKSAPVNRLAEWSSSSPTAPGRGLTSPASAASVRVEGAAPRPEGATGDAVILLTVGAGLFGSLAVCVGAAWCGRKLADWALKRKSPVLQICTPGGSSLQKPAQLARQCWNCRIECADCHTARGSEPVLSEQCFLGRGGPICERSDCYCKRRYGPGAGALPAKQARECPGAFCDNMECPCKLLPFEERVKSYFRRPSE